MLCCWSNLLIFLCVSWLFVVFVIILVLILGNDKLLMVVFNVYGVNIFIFKFSIFFGVIVVVLNLDIVFLIFLG